MVKEAAEEKSRDPITVNLHWHVLKHGLFLWSVGAEPVRFLLRIDHSHRGPENGSEGAGMAALSGYCNQRVEK